MSHVEKAFTVIRAAAQKAGGISQLVEGTDINVDTARRMMRKEPQQIKLLRDLEAQALTALGDTNE